MASSSSLSHPPHRHEPQRRHHHHPFATLPEDGSIERGSVVRIEPYGAFVQLDNFRARGLVHISQLAPYKIERVEDAVSLNDAVWVKVLEVTTDTTSTTDNDNNNRPPLRHKIRLSLKDAAQDGSRQDLGAERADREAQTRTIQQNLSSSIGMGVALDPMATTSGSSNSKSGGGLVLKHERNQPQNATVINGYALVDDTEGEPETGVAAVEPARSTTTTTKPIAVRVQPPLGRGRGATLPAWMTRGDDGPTKVAAGAPAEEEEEERSRRRRHKSSSRRKHKHHHHHKSSKSRKREERKHKKYPRKDHHRKRRRRSHSRSRSRSRESDTTNERQQPRRRTSRSYSVDSQRRSSSDDEMVRFGSVQEAKELIAELEAKKEAATRDSRQR